jgi:Ca2+-binding RTX toxin-like protein
MPTQTGTLGDDTLIGVDGQDNLIFGDPTDVSGGQFDGGDDTLIGGANANNTLVGDTDTMTGTGSGGNDTLIGGIGGTNILIGDAFTAGGGIPSGGDDRLVSAANTPDDMWGDFQEPGPPGQPSFGHDTFVFGPNNGDDIINDFHQGEDIIEIHATPIPINAAEHIPAQAAQHFPPQAVGSFSDLDIDVVGSDSIIHFGAEDSVTVLGVTNLTADDFLFLI